MMNTFNFFETTMPSHHSPSSIYPSKCTICAYKMNTCLLSSGNIIGNLVAKRFWLVGWFVAPKRKKPKLRIKQVMRWQNAIVGDVIATLHCHHRCSASAAVQNFDISIKFYVQRFECTNMVIIFSQLKLYLKCCVSMLSTI